MEEAALARIPEERYADYRREVIFKAYKWDPQVADHNTVARHAVLLSPDCAARIARQAEAAAAETLRMEQALLHRRDLVKKLGIPAPLRKALLSASEDKLATDPARHVRLMRFDFHPTGNGWAVSEVNSDVPGGLAEASIWPGIACRFLREAGMRDISAPPYSTGEQLLRAFGALLPPGGRVALVHATSYADDRQVMQFLGDTFQRGGYTPVYAAPDHIRFDGDGRAVHIAENAPLDALLRFFPLEWLCNLPRRARWRDFTRARTPSCNYAAAMLTQSKRLPLVWDRLGAEHPAWSALLPETRDPRRAKGPDWVLKPALGRVGEGVLLPGIAEKERRRIEKAARRRPQDWIAQRRFASRGVPDETGQAWRLCVGVFTVNGSCAGFYGRMSQSLRIDAGALDVPVLIAARSEEHNGKQRQS